MDENDAFMNDDEFAQSKRPERQEKVQQAKPSGHSMTRRSQTKKTQALELNWVQKNPKRPVMTDGEHKVTGNTIVKRIVLDDSIAVIEEEKKRKLKGLLNAALFIFNASLSSDPGEPKADDQALNRPERDWWIPACVAEINNFLDRGSWKFVPQKLVQGLNRKLIGTKMVYKKKEEANGTTRYKARYASKGFMQIPGVDFTEKFSPIATDTSIRIVIALILFFWDSHGWRARGIDIEAAFLESFLQKKYYLEPSFILVLLKFMTTQEF